MKLSSGILTCTLFPYHYRRCHDNHQIPCSSCQKSVFLRWFCIFLSIFFMRRQKFMNLYISYTFWPDFVLISIISWIFVKMLKSKVRYPRWWVKWLLWCQMTSLLAKMYHFVEQPQCYLIYVNLFLFDLTEQKPREGFYPRPLRHGGGTS